MMIAIAMDKKRRNAKDAAGKAAPPVEDAAPTMERDDADEGVKRNCVYLGGELPDLPAGEITATVRGTVVGEGEGRRIEVAEVNGVKLPGEAVEPEDDDGKEMSSALAEEYGSGGGDQEEA